MASDDSDRPRGFVSAVTGTVTGTFTEVTGKVAGIGGQLWGYIGFGDQGESEYKPEREGQMEGEPPNKANEVGPHDDAGSDWVNVPDGQQLDKQDIYELATLKQMVKGYDQQLIDLSALVYRIGNEKEELIQELSVRDQQLLALREEANAIVRKNHEFASENSKLKLMIKPLTSSTVQGSASPNDAMEVQRLQEHVKDQSRKIAQYRKEIDMLEARLCTNSNNNKTCDNII